jgi:hypothetical protein
MLLLYHKAGSNNTYEGANGATKQNYCSKVKVVIERIGEDGNLMLIARFRSGDILGGNLVFRF